MCKTNFIFLTKDIDFYILQPNFQLKKKSLLGFERRDSQTFETMFKVESVIID